MAKFYGSIGFANTEETSPGVYEEVITTRNYYGDVIKTSRKLQATDSLNENVSISNEISIIADPFANGNFHSMRYVEFMGAKWKITDVTIQFPRLILTVGGVYNG